MLHGLPLRILRVAIAACLIPLGTAVLAQDTPRVDTTRTEKGRLEKVASNLDSLEVLSFEAGRMKFVPFIAPSCSPERQFLLTAGGP